MRLGPFQHTSAALCPASRVHVGEGSFHFYIVSKIYLRSLAFYFRSQTDQSVFEWDHQLHPLQGSMPGHVHGVSLAIRKTEKDSGVADQTSSIVIN